MGLFDQMCNAKTRMTYPTLYHSTQKSDLFNLKTFWIWIGTSIYHSVLLFSLPMLGYMSFSVWPNGKTGDYLVIGNIVYSFVVVTVCCKAGLEMDSWSWVSHASIWGSMAAWFLFLVIYSYFWVIGLPLAANMAGMCELIYTTPLFWLGLLLIPFVTLIADILYKAVKVTVFTTETDKIRIAEIKQKDVGAYVDDPPVQSGLRLSEASSLLQNFRKKMFRNGGTTRSPKRQANEEVELQHGYAFSQEEGGAISQVEFIRRYDTTTRSSSAASRGGT